MSSEAIEKLSEIERKEKRTKILWLTVPVVIFVAAILYVIPAKSVVIEGEIITIMPLYAQAARQNGFCKVRLESGKKVNAPCKVNHNELGNRVRFFMSKSSFPPHKEI